MDQGNYHLSIAWGLSLLFLKKIKIIVLWSNCIFHFEGVILDNVFPFFYRLSVVKILSQAASCAKIKDCVVNFDVPDSSWD
jgi:hypothetical protein